MSRRRREDFYRQLSTQPARFAQWTEVLREVQRKDEEQETEDAEELAAERREQERQRKEQRVTQQTLQRLVDEILPEELVMLILEYVVDSKAPELDLKDSDTLRMTSQSLLGLSTPAQKLYPLAEQVLLERSRIQLDIPFARDAGGGEPIAQIPAFVLRLPHPIRHLRLPCQVEIRGNRLTYPITIFRLMRGAASLKHALPDLHTITILLNLDVEEAPAHRALDMPCFCGYTATTTYRELVLKMLTALYDSGPARKKILKMTAHENRCERMYEADEVILEPSPPEIRNDEDEEKEPAHPMKAVLDQACNLNVVTKPKAEKKPAKPKVRRRTVAPVRLRDNLDMTMLEEEAATVGYSEPLPSSALMRSLRNLGGVPTSQTGALEG